MKTIGVLGGLGPQATLDFEARVHQVSQRLIPQMGNSGYPPMVVVYVRHPPVILREDLRPVFPLQPHTQLLETARKLGEWSDFLVITANAPHIFQENIEAASGCKVLSMIEVALEEVERRPAGKVGVLGFGEPLVYQVPLDKLSIPYETLPVESRDRLDQAIWAVWEGRVGDQERQIASEVVDWLRARNTEMIILGCTEIPLLLGELADQPDLINPAQLLAEAAVRYAMQE